MSKKVKFEREYILNSPPAILFPQFSTPGGLLDWFSNVVNINGHIFTFIWDDLSMDAELVVKKLNSYIRFRWLDDED